MMRFRYQTLMFSLVFLQLAACGSAPPAADLKIADAPPLAAQDPMGLATLALVPADDASQVYCTAVLIKPDVAITAAHCIDADGALINLAAGVDLLQNPIMLQGRAQRHESYGAPYNEALSFDLALIRLTSPAPAPLRPVPLAREADFKPGSAVSIVGYGSSQKAESAAAAQPNTRLRSMRAVIQRIYTPDEEDVSEYGLFVSQSADGRAAACEGDSGAPSFVRRGAELLVGGITVGGFGRCNTLAYHSNLAFYEAWIASQLQ